MSDIVADALSDWDRIQGDAPKRLYHYTDVARVVVVPVGYESALHE
jgi:hypothetical protein